MTCRLSPPSSGKPSQCRRPRQTQGGPKDDLLSISHEPSKAKVIVAPVCPSGKTAKDMTCHCSKEPAVQGIDGNSRGGCVPSPNLERERKTALQIQDGQWLTAGFGLIWLVLMSTRK